MRSVAEFINHLAKDGITLHPDGNSIRATGDLAKLQDHIPELRRQKQAVLDHLQQRSISLASPRLEPVSRPPRIPLSRAQRVWFPARAGKASYYRVPALYRIEGPLNAPCLAEALRLLVERYEILRTRYHTDGPECWQEVVSPPPPILDLLDVSHLPFQQREAAAQEQLNSLWDRDEPEFSSGRNLHARLCKLGPEDHALHMWINHIAADGPSLPILIEDLFEIYCALEGGERPELPPIDLHYADYAIWEDRCRSLASADPRYLAWRRAYDDVRSPNLRESGDLGASDSIVGRRSFIADIAWVDAVAAAKTVGATSAILALTLAGAMLSRWSGQQRFIIGVIANTRPAPARRVVGCFTRVRPLLLDFSGDPTIAEALRRTRAAYAHAMNRAFDLSEEEFEDLGVATITINIQRTPIERRYLTTPPTVRVSRLQFGASPLKRIDGDLKIGISDYVQYVIGSVTFAEDRLDQARANWLVTELPLVMRRFSDNYEAPLWSLIGPFERSYA